MKVLAVVALSLVSSFAVAKNAVPYFQQLSAAAPFGPEMADYRWTTPAQVKEGKARFGAQKRLPSNLKSADESMMSAEFRSTRDRFVKIQSSEELETFLTDLEKNYESFKEDDQRFFAAHMIPLREFRGVVWRSFPVFNQAKITHSFVLTMMKSSSASMHIYMPTEQWKAGFDYVTQPYVRDGKIVNAFRTEADINAFMAGAVRNSLLKAARRLQAIDLRDKWIVWDNQLLFGQASFADSLDRYRMVGEVERISSLASLHGAMSQITFQRAYSSEHSVKLFKDLGKLYGTDGFLSEIDGAPSSKRAAVMRRKDFTNYGVLLSDGSKWMDLSLRHLQESVRLSATVWDQIKREDRPATDAFLFDASFARAYERGGDLSIANMLAMVEGPTQLRSGITGETVTVDLPAFYRNPPRDLKGFLPTAFEQGDEWKQVQLKDGSGQLHALKYRNYNIGRGVNWSKDSYRQIFPGLKNGTDVPTHLRVASQSWGMWLAVAPIAEMIE